MARPELGIKRQCMNCGAKFYDLARDPATCPKCGTVFQMAAVGGRTAAPALNRKDEDEEDEDDAAPDTVSLDEAEASDDSDTTVDGDDGDDDNAASGDDDTFLEEEDDDDVSDLVDNDGDNDEES